MSETYPRKTLCETLFAGHTPSRVGSYLARSLERFFHGAKVVKNLRICKFFS